MKLGDRMKKKYENITRHYLPARTYTILRLDGRSFHTYTKNLIRPFDAVFRQDMNSLALYLCNEIAGAKIAYIQSDEISLLLTDFDKISTEAWFGGNIQKICSISAALASTKFSSFRTYAPLAVFDARVFTINDPIEVENYFIWRQQDAERNSLSSLAQSLYSHKELHNKNASKLHDLIHAKGSNWNDLDSNFKRGSWAIKHKVVVPPLTLHEKQTEEVEKTSWHSVGAPCFSKEEGRSKLTAQIPKMEV